MWTVANPDGRLSFTSYDAARNAVAPLRPILQTEYMPGVWEEHTCLMRRNGKPFCRGVEELGQHNEIEFVHTDTLHYLGGAVEYHCRRLAETYARITRNFQRLAPAADHTWTVMFGGTAEPYYEFDAVMGAARRLYDATRYLLWARFGPPRGSVPRSLAVLLKNDRMMMPPALHCALLESWNRFGMRITAYRDCVHHYVPIDFGQSALLRRHQQTGAWITMMRIPDNPEARSKNKFTFEQDLDALAVAWEVADEALAAAQLVVAGKT